jgi:hypothetical protein
MFSPTAHLRRLVSSWGSHWKAAKPVGRRRSLLLEVLEGRLNPSLVGTITAVAGTGANGFGGDNGPATAAVISSPEGVAVDSNGNLFIADAANHRVREVTSSGIITTVAGNGGNGSGGDGGPATAAQLASPVGVAVDNNGDLFIVDQDTNTVRKVVLSTGQISTVAGNGTPGFSGDNGPAVAAQLSFPEGVAVDSSGNLYIADTLNNVIRKVTPSGTITTVVGTGTLGSAGDGGQATSAELANPFGITVDNQGDLFIADFANSRIRKVNSSGIISTVAGNGSQGFSGDGGSATAAALNNPSSVAVDKNGNLFIADINNNLIREVTSGIITTVAGNGSQGFGGDGGAGTSAKLFFPQGVAVDGNGDLFIADLGNRRVRVVENITFTADTPPDAIYGTPDSYTFQATGEGTITYSSPNLPSWATLNPTTGSLTGTPPAVGTYTFTLVGSSGLAHDSVTVSLKVDPAALTVTASNQIKTYGATVAFTGSEFTTSGLKLGDTIGSVTLSSAGTAATANAGIYTIAISAASGGTFNPANYTITYASGLFNVTPAALTIIPDNQSKTYGDAIVLPNTAFTARGLQNGETVGSVSLSSAGAADTANAGNYAILGSAAAGSTFNPGNYSIFYAPGTLTVTPAALSIRADDRTKTYGTTLALPGTAFTATGLQNGDTIGSVTFFSPGTIAGAGAGVYAITPSTGTGGTFNLSNYAITYAPGTLTVTPAALTITVDNQTKTYGDPFAFQGTEFTSSGLVNGDTITSVTLTSLATFPTTGVGSYSIIASGAPIGSLNSANYTITYVNGTFTVTPAALTITATDQSKTYGATLVSPSSAFTSTGLKNGDAIGSVTLFSPGAAATAGAGSYLLVANSATGGTFTAGNYTINYVDGTLAVTAPVTAPVAPPVAPPIVPPVTPPTVTDVPSVSIASGPSGVVVDVVDSTGVLTQFDATGAHVLGGGVRAASVAFGPRGAVMVVTYQTGALVQFDASGPHALAGGGVRSARVAFGPAGEVLIVTSESGMVTQFDAAGTLVLAPSGVRDASVAFGPQGEVLVVTTESGALLQFDAAGSHQLAASGVQGAGVAFGAPDSVAEVLVVLFGDGSLEQFGSYGSFRLGTVS